MIVMDYDLSVFFSLIVVVFIICYYRCLFSCYGLRTLLCFCFLLSFVSCSMFVTLLLFTICLGILFVSYCMFIALLSIRPFLFRYIFIILLLFIMRLSIVFVSRCMFITLFSFIIRLSITFASRCIFTTSAAALAYWRRETRHLRMAPR